MGGSLVLWSNVFEYFDLKPFPSWIQRLIYSAVALATGFVFSVSTYSATESYIGSSLAINKMIKMPLNITG
jgi:hypothetical protein